jgi:hypothetical protein
LLQNIQILNIIILDGFVIPLSLALGSFGNYSFLELGFGEEKLDGYLGGINGLSEG